MLGTTDFESIAEDKAFGALYGNVVGFSFSAMLFSTCTGDAIGAPLEFTSALRFTKDRLVCGFTDSVWEDNRFNRFKLKVLLTTLLQNRHFQLSFKSLLPTIYQPGQWTDDTSMALCLADSLIVCRRFDPFDLKVRFLNW